MRQRTAQAQRTSTLDKIKASGSKVVLGVRRLRRPWPTRWAPTRSSVGYHVELCERVLREIVPQTKLEYMAVTAQNTLPWCKTARWTLAAAPPNNTARQQQVALP